MLSSVRLLATTFNRVVKTGGSSVHEDDLGGLPPKPLCLLNAKRKVLLATSVRQLGDVIRECGMKSLLAKQAD